MEPTNLLPPDLNTPVNNSPGTIPVAPPPEENFSEKHGWYRALQERGILLPVLLIVLVPTLFAAVVYRYDIYGVFKTQNYSVEIIDPANNQPLSDAKVILRGVVVRTNNYGVATFQKIKVGKAPISISKLYYHDFNTVTLVTFTNHKYHVFGLEAAATEVKLSVENKITQQPVQNVLISSANNTAVTNSEGDAYMSLPSSTVPIPVITSVKNYNPSSALMYVLTPNNLSLIPTGKVYYLSNTTGPLSLISSNLDGTNPQSVIAGGASAQVSNSQIAYSHDSNYVAVNMPNSSGVPTLSIYNTQTGKVVNLGQSALGFNLNGWTHDNILIYTTISNNVGDDGTSVVYGYNITKSGSMPYRLDVATAGDGGQYAGEQVYGSVNILNDDNVAFSKYWTGTPLTLTNAVTSLNSLKATATFYVVNGNVNQETLKPTGQYLTPPKIVYTSPTTLDLAFTNSVTDKVSYFSYSGGKYTTGGSAVPSAMAAPAVSSSYFLSPSASSQMWSKVSGETTTIYVGNEAGGNSSAIATVDNSYTPYGWYTDQYILLNKSGALYIMPSSGSNNQTKLQEVASFTP